MASAKKQAPAPAFRGSFADFTIIAKRQPDGTVNFVSFSEAKDGRIIVHLPRAPVLPVVIAGYRRQVNGLQRMDMEMEPDHRFNCLQFQSREVSSTSVSSAGVSLRDYLACTAGDKVSTNDEEEVDKENEDEAQPESGDAQGSNSFRKRVGAVVRGFFNCLGHL